MRPSAAVAQVGVNGVGKVHRGGPLRQLDDGGLRGQHVDAVFQHGTTGLCAGAGEVALPGQQLAQHHDFGVIGAAGGDASAVAFGARFLVGPVRSNTVFGMVVHGLRADLDFDGFARLVAHHGVQRLVAIGFGAGDVVIKLFHQRLKLRVHPAQGGVAVGNRVGDDPQCTDVKHLVKVERLAAHFFDDAVNVLGPPLHTGPQPFGTQVVLQPGA